MLRPNREALRLACSVVAAIAALHVGWILVLLRRDAAEPNFAALRTEDQLQLLSREIVLMHHKRLPELNNTLSRLGGLADADRLRITLIQSLDASEASAADATAALLRSISIRFPWLRIDHKPIVRALEAEGGGDGTYSVDAKQYGTKRNSFRNLLAGLDAVFASHPELRSAIVLEDDVLLANDAIDFFDMAASLLDERSSVAAAADSPVTARPVLATSFCFMRDNHEDYRWWRHLWARGIAGGATRYRVGPLRAVTIKTFAWLLRREVWETMRHDMLSGPDPMLTLPAGFGLHVVRYDLHQLLDGTPAAPWLANLEEWQRGPYYYSHVTDALRLAILFRVGGVYLDFDVLVTRPIKLAWSAKGIGTMSSAAASSKGVEGSVRPLRNALGIESYGGLGGLSGPTLNGAVMAFERGSRFLWNCLDDFATEYIADRWSWNGPELLTRVQLRCMGVDGADVQLEPRESFYPIYWQGLDAFASTARSASEDARLRAAIQQWSYTVHAWNKKTAQLVFAEGSLLHWLYNQWTVLPSRENCS